LTECPQIKSDNELLEWIADSSGGNPLFLRSLISHYQATGERFVIPSTLSALIDQQLLSMSPDAFSVLSMCVALGRYSDIEHLVAALEITHLQLQNAIRELEAASLLATLGGRIEPAHWLIADSVTRVVSPIARKLLHRRVAQTLESEAAQTRSASSYWDCAEHWILADEPLRAGAALETCASHSVGMGRPGAAAELLLRAANLLAGEARARFLRRCIELAELANEPAVVLQAIETARCFGILIEIPDLELIEANARLVVQDDTGFACDTFRRWLEESRPIASRLRAAACLLTLAIVNCDMDLANEALRRLNPELGQKDQALETKVLAFLMVYESRFGNKDSALMLANRLLSIVNDEPPAFAIEIKRKCAIVCILEGEVAQGIEILQAAFAEASVHGLTRMQCLLGGCLSDFTAALGDDISHQHWAAVLDSVTDSVMDSRMYADIAFQRAERACLSGDRRTARRWIDAIRNDCGIAPTVRISRSLRLLEIWISKLDGSVLNVDATVDALTSHHRAQFEYNDIGDIEIYVAMDLLVAVGREEEARALLDRYTADYRRSRCPLARPLQEIALRVDWQGDLMFTPATRTRRVQQPVCRNAPGTQLCALD
jgi:hypothetical protein